MDLQWTKDIRECWNTHRTTCNQHSTNSGIPEWSSPQFMALQPQNLQHRLFQELSKLKWNDLLNHSSQHNKIRLTSCSAIGSSAFLRAPADSQGCHFTNEEFQIAIKMRINAPLNLLCPSRCICDSDLDDQGDHFFKCRIGPEWEQRHSSLVHCMASILRSANLIVQHEVPLSTLGPLRDLDSSGDGRMDLTITSCDSTPLLADVTIIHPIISQINLNSSSVTSPLHFAKHRERAKIRKYGDRVAQLRQQFLPFVLETFGAMGPMLDTYLKKLAHRASRDSMLTQRAQLIRCWRTKISACLQRANARLILSKSHRVRARLRQGTAPREASSNLILDIS